jgi:NADP-dependent 3-hydroxy acid dehydrogenase YdfG
VALVAAANKGIGLEISRQIAAAGISVWMGGRDANLLRISSPRELSVRPLPLNVADSRGHLDVDCGNWSKKRAAIQGFEF